MLEEVRDRCRWVAEMATHVRVDHARLPEYAERLAESDWDAAAMHPTPNVGDDEAAVAFAVTVGAVNFGSGWHPALKKRRGLSGALTISTSLADRLRAGGPVSAADLSSITAADCAAIFGQSGAEGPVADLMDLYARSLNELGEFLSMRFDGSFMALVAAAAGSAESLVQLLLDMPTYRDVSRYRGTEVPFLKRAQLTAADVARALQGRPPGDFSDLHRLTAFADNLVPHVLRVEGALSYAPRLSARIDAGRLVPAGSPEECEIRAAGVHAVELLVGLLASRGRPTTPMELDSLLWTTGQRPAYKALPRHRTRTIYY